MAPPDNSRVALGDGAFQYVGEFVDIINSYAARQAAAKSAIDSALGLGKIFVGEEGAALREQILSGNPNIHLALTDTTNTIDDLEELGLLAEQALRNIRNVDEVVGGLFQQETVAHGDPGSYDRPQYKPTTTTDAQGNPIPAELRGPGSLEAEMEQADQIGDEIEQERRQQPPAS
jgi:hypothetical protein